MDAKNLSHSGFCAQRSFWRMHFMYFVLLLSCGLFVFLLFGIFSLLPLFCLWRNRKKKSRHCCHPVKDRFPPTFVPVKKRVNLDPVVTRLRTVEPSLFAKASQCSTFSFALHLRFLLIYSLCCTCWLLPAWQGRYVNTRECSYLFCWIVTWCFSFPLFISHCKFCIIYSK